MGKYRKKPVVIEAVQFLPGDGYKQGDRFEAHGLMHVIHEGRLGPVLLIDTLEGEMQAGYGDWIIKGVKGEIYPCKPDIFEATYEAVDE